MSVQCRGLAGRRHHGCSYLSGRQCRPNLPHQTLAAQFPAAASARPGSRGLQHHGEAMDPEDRASLRRATHGAAASDPIRGSHYATAQAIAVSGRTAPNDGSKLRYFVDGEFGDISKTDEQSSLGYAWATEEGDVLQQHCSGLSQVSKFSCPPRSQGDKTSDSISSHTSEPPWRKNLTRSVNHASFSSGVSWSGE